MTANTLFGVNQDGSHLFAIKRGACDSNRQTKGEFRLEKYFLKIFNTYFLNVKTFMNISEHECENNDYLFTIYGRKIYAFYLMSTSKVISFIIRLLQQ